MPGLILPQPNKLILPPSLLTPGLPPPGEGGGPNPPFKEDFMDYIVNVHWRTGEPAAAFSTGAYIVSLGATSNQVTLLAVSGDGLNWNFWAGLTGDENLWTLAGVPSGRGMALMACGAHEPQGEGAQEAAVAYITTDFGRSWSDQTPPIDGDAGLGTECDGGGGSYGARALMATTWAGQEGPSINSVNLNFGGGWEEVASASDPDAGGYEFPDGIIPPDTICYNCAGVGFSEFPPSYPDPVGPQGCPYLAPDGSRGIYYGVNTAIGPPGVLTGGPPFQLQIVGQEAGSWKTIEVDVLDATGLQCTAMFFANNYPLP